MLYNALLYGAIHEVVEIGGEQIILGQKTFDASIVAKGGITTSAENLQLQPVAGYYTIVGTGSPSWGHVSTNNDLFVSGDCEIRGWLDVTNYLNLPSASYGIIFDQAPNQSVINQNPGSSPRTLTLAPSGRALVICEVADRTSAWNSGTLANPHIFVQSSDATQINQWIALTHDQANGVVKSGVGDVKIEASSKLLSVEGIKKKRVVVNSNAYTTVAGDSIIGVPYTTTSAVTITLGSATVKDGVIISIKDEGGNAGTNNITINTEGTETIDGAASKIINTNYGGVNLYSDGTNWFII